MGGNLILPIGGVKIANGVVRAQGAMRYVGLGESSCDDRKLLSTCVYFAKDLNRKFRVQLRSTHERRGGSF
jgi:hypothetical protein